MTIDARRGLTEFQTEHTVSYRGNRLGTKTKVGIATHVTGQVLGTTGVADLIPEPGVSVDALLLEKGDAPDEGGANRVDYTGEIEKIEWAPASDIPDGSEPFEIFIDGEKVLFSRHTTQISQAEFVQKYPDAMAKHLACADPSGTFGPFECVDDVAKRMDDAPEPAPPTTGESGLLAGSRTLLFGLGALALVLLLALAGDEERRSPRQTRA